MKDKLRDVSQPFYAIKQTGSVEAYVKLFYELSSQVTGFPTKQLEGIFMNGLKHEMQEVFMVCKPVDLPDLISWAITMEDSAYYRMVCKDKKVSRVTDQYQQQFKSVSEPSSQSGWKMKAITTKAQNSGSRNNNKSAGRPHQFLSKEEIAYKRRLGLCFKCDAKWSRFHLVNGVCPKKSLQILTLMNGLEVEVLDGNKIEWSDGDVEYVGNLIELSLNSFWGQSSPTATKMLGVFKKVKVVVMLDSGATHNFISPTVIPQAHIQPEQSQAFEVSLGTGVKVKGLGVCRNISFLLQDLRFSADFIALELGSANVILGIQWLRTLGKCHVDWASHELSSIHQNQ